MNTKIIQFIKIIWDRNEKFFKYCLIGLSGATLDFVAFYILSEGFNIYYQYANIISVSLGITNNFFLNAYLNFKIRENLLSRFISFYLIGLLGLAISASLLYMLIDKLYFIPLLAKAITIFIVAVIQYSLNKSISFRKFKTYG